MIISQIEDTLWQWAEQVHREASGSLGYSTRSCFTTSLVGSRLSEGIPYAYLDATMVEASVTALPAPLKAAIQERYLGLGGETPRRSLYQRLQKAHKILARRWGIDSDG